MDTIDETLRNLISNIDALLDKENSYIGSISFDLASPERAKENLQFNAELSGMKKINLCEVCGTIYESTRSTKKTCSQVCRNIKSKKVKS